MVQRGYETFWPVPRGRIIIIITFVVRGAGGGQFVVCPKEMSRFLSVLKSTQMSLNSTVAISRTSKVIENVLGV